MIRVTLDSNIYVSALTFGGIPRSILELAEDGRFKLAVSEYICWEVEQVLLEKFGWPEERIAWACKPIWNFCHMVVPVITVSLTEDPADNRILECALAAKACVLVSGDKHLLKLKTFQDIPIITAREFLDAKPWKRPS